MRPKRPALAQARPARTVRRRRLQQRPPHLDGREAPAGDPAAAEAAPAAEQREPTPPASTPGPAPALEAPAARSEATPAPVQPPAEPELPLLEAEAVVPLSREASVRSAIRAHQAWTEALRAAVAGKAPLDVKAVLAHDRCALAAWLAGEGQRFAGPGLAEVALWHRRYHAAAAVVAIRAAAGRPWEAARLLEGPSYLTTSASLVSALEDLLAGG